MLEVGPFGDELRRLGFDFASGVPCSSLKGLINYATANFEYVAAANEGDAAAICAGAEIGGRRSFVLMQNSGLTNASSPLVSLNQPFKIPQLGFVSLRGEEGKKDEPQHELVGRITEELLSLMEIETEFLDTSSTTAAEQLARADEVLRSGRSFFFIVRKGTFESFDVEKKDVSLPPQSRDQRAQDRKFSLPSRSEALEAVSSGLDERSALLATTGYTGRELYNINDSERNLYMVGSMGCISSLALGLALSRPSLKVCAIDGDGSLLMRMGSLATNAFYRPPNLLHVLLDNGMHESTGGQFTSSSVVDFFGIAAASGYPQVWFAHSAEELESLVGEWSSNPTLTFIVLKTRAGVADNLPRPKEKPFEVKERFMNYLNSES